MRPGTQVRIKDFREGRHNEYIVVAFTDLTREPSALLSGFALSLDDGDNVLIASLADGHLGWQSTDKLEEIK